MKPYGREKSVRFPGKKDCHPKRGWKNWWDGIADSLSRSRMKQRLREEIEEEILEKAAHRTDLKSPFTGGKCTLEEEETTVKYRGEYITVKRKFYRCADTGHEFTDSDLDDDFMWAVFRKWCEGKNFETFQDICPWKEEMKENLAQ